MATVTIQQAKTNLSRLIARAEAGEEILIARGRTPVVRLVALRRAGGSRGLADRRGLAGSMASVWPDLPYSFFFEPLPDAGPATHDQKVEDDGDK